MELAAKTTLESASDTALAIVLEGVSEKWQMNVLQIRGCPTRVKVMVDGYGAVDAPAIALTPDQARRLATQITEILGLERS
jgi:uncharacterized metal-binding protein